MTAKEFVLKHYPDARAEIIKRSVSLFNNKKYTCWLILFGNEKTFEYPSESKAWVNAKKDICSLKGIN